MLNMCGFLQLLLYEVANVLDLAELLSHGKLLDSQLYNKEATSTIGDG